MLLAVSFVFGSALMTRSARAQVAGVDESLPTGAIRFNLPAQPLDQALLVFGRMTQLVVLAPSPLIRGRISTPLAGDYTPREALQRVLTDTGLEAYFTGPDDAVIVVSPPGEAALQPPWVAESVAIPPYAIDGVMVNGDFRDYAAMVQTRLTEALCRSSQTLPGSYRLVAQLRIDGKGKVVASDVVVSTGLPARDAAIEHAVRTLALDSAPPAGMLQPITLLLRPVGNGVRIDCSPIDGSN
jgi:TonB C terminal